MKPARTTWLIVSPWIAVAALIAGTVDAEVIGVSANGFEVREQLHMELPADKVYEAILSPARWWSSEHTYSGNAANMTLDPRAGGCWCEKLENGGSVQHLQVIYVSPGHALRLRGALGPLQAMAVDGAMTWTLKNTPKGTDITLTYAVGGYSKDGFAALSTAVDQVLADQVARLRNSLQAP
jgi:uncharacterized protein YndB with AHSA1/START domain